MLSVVVSAQYNVDKLITSGRIALYYEDYVLGMQYFNQALIQKPFLWEPWQLRAIAKFNLDDFQGAEQDATEALRLNPYITQIYDLRGICRIRQSNFDGAIEDYNRAIKLQPTSQNFWYNRAICRFEMKDYEKTHADLDTIINKWSKFASPYLLKAEVYLHQKDTMVAEKWIARSLEVDPYNAEAWRVRAHICLANEKWKEADEFFSKAIHLKPKFAGNYVNRAAARLKMNNLRGCMSDYDLALEFDPNNFLAHYNRGLLRLQVGDDNRAIEDFDFVLAHEPDNVMALFNRATLLDRTGDLKAAIRDYTKVIDQFPNFWTGLHYRAGCYRRLGMTAKAEMDEFTILKAQMDKHLGKQVRWSRKKLAEIRKKSEIDPEKYNQLVVEDDVSDGHEYKSEFRGHVQNRQVSNEYQPYICLSVFNYKNGLTNYHPYEKDIEIVNKSLSVCKLNVATLDSQHSVEELQAKFALIDTLTTLIAHSNDDKVISAYLLARTTINCIAQNYDEALRDIDANVSIDSTSAIVWWQRAVCNARLSEFDATETAQTIDLRYASVNSDFEKAHRYSPDNAYVLYCHGTFLARIKRYKEALQKLNQALALDGKLAEAYFNRGLVLLYSGDRVGAIADLGKAGELGLYSAYNLIKKNTKK